MNWSKHILDGVRASAIAMLSAAAVPMVSGKETAPATAVESSRSAIAQIDAELDLLARQVPAAPTPAQGEAIKSEYNALKQRRNELKKDFTETRYDELSTDLQVAKDKVSAWAKEEAATTNPKASAAVSVTNEKAADAAAKVEDYRNESSDLNKAEAKAALYHLDTDINLLNAKIEAVLDPAQKSELKHSLKLLKERRAELTGDFRKARYDALVDDVKAEWNKVTSAP
jgi:hypothetical protein